MTAGEVMTAYIEKGLAGMQARKAAVEGRGVTVITSSGTLVTLLLAFLVVSPGKMEHNTGAKILVALSLLGFTLSSTFGVLVNVPRKGQEPRPDSLHGHLAEPYWSASANEAQKVIATAQLHTWQTTFDAWRSKSKLLLYAFVSQLFAVLTLGLGVLLVVL
ncbi:hypothetical protein [Streptomyces sp. NPDC058751]|uniref:hypothetical protein n=1 Tax=Streptomyces sp. NPDC058751 TaxID=3346623 RepID=UPI0036CE542C